MPYEVECTDEFVEWWDGLTREQKQAVEERVELLEHNGPQQGAPYVKRIVASTLHHLKELRCNEEGSLRVLFIFDPRRMAILLLGGDKTGRWKEWYDENIPRPKRSMNATWMSSAQSDCSDASGLRFDYGARE